MIINTTLKKRERPIKAPERKFTIRKDNNINNWTIEWMSRKHERKLREIVAKITTPYAMRFSWRVLQFQRRKRKLCGNNADRLFNIFPII